MRNVDSDSERERQNQKSKANQTAVMVFFLCLRFCVSVLRIVYTVLKLTRLPKQLLLAKLLYWHGLRQCMSNECPTMIFHLNFMLDLVIEKHVPVHFCPCVQA
jgi:hypothetical protein